MFRYNSLQRRFVRWLRSNGSGNGYLVNKDINVAYIPKKQRDGMMTDISGNISITGRQFKQFCNKFNITTDKEIDFELDSSYVITVVKVITGPVVLRFSYESLYVEKKIYFGMIIIVFVIWIGLGLGFAYYYLVYKIKNRQKLPVFLYLIRIFSLFRYYLLPHLYIQYLNLYLFLSNFL